MIRTALALTLLTGLTTAQKQDKDIWMTDFAAAKAKATAQGKDLLVDFTGSDWCGWCIKLDDEVFSKDEFKSSAQKIFVLVKIDYPRNQSILSKDVIAQNEKLKNEYSIQGYPTILLMDAAGRVFGQAGYEPGGPAPYNAMLAKKVRQATGFKAALAHAEGKKGIERAQALEDCLAALDEQIADTYHYDLLKEIVTLDADGKAGLKAKYAKRVAQLEEVRAQADAMRMTMAANAELQKLIGKDMENNEGKKALAKLDAVIQSPKSKMHKQMALFFKGMVIMDTTQNVKHAITALEAALKVAPTSPISDRINQMLPQIRKQAGGGN